MTFKQILISWLAMLSIFLFSACSSMKTATNDTDKKNKKIAEINIQLALGYIQAGDMQRAKQKLLYAFQKNPTLPEVWYSMGYFQEITGNKAEAKTDYLKAVQLAPERGDVQNNYGTFLCRTGNYSDAIKHFLVATRDPQYLETASAYENAGLCALKIPNRKLARQFFSQALESDPNRKISQEELNKLGGF